MNEKIRVLLPDGTEREYVPARIVMKHDAFLKRAKLLYCSSTSTNYSDFDLYEGEDEATGKERLRYEMQKFLDYICGNEALYNELMQLYFDGDHSGFNWYEIDAGASRNLQLFFYIIFGVITKENLKDMLESSTSMPEKLQAGTKQAKTRSRTKNRHGQSRTARKTSIS